MSKAETMRRGVLDYFKAQGYVGDLSWHPLFQAAKDLYLFLLDEDARKDVLVGTDDRIVVAFDTRNRMWFVRVNDVVVHAFRSKTEAVAAANRLGETR